MRMRKLLLGAAVGLIAVGVASQKVQAASVDVDATIQTKAAISLTKNNDMGFGTVEFDATHGGQIRLATNGTASLNAATGLTLSGTANAADVDITGDGNSTIEISCETGGILTDSGGANPITLQNTEIAIDTGVAFGSGTACAGLGTSPATVDLSSNATPTVLMGGELDVTGNAIAVSDSFSTANGGTASPVTLQVVYQ